MSVVITLNTDGPREPGYVLEVAEGLAESVRVLCHLTRDHEALEHPAEAYQVACSLELMAERLPQLLEQLSRWYAARHAAGALRVTEGEYAGQPGRAATAAMMRLGAAGISAESFGEDLKAVSAVTAWIAGPEDGGPASG